MKSENDNSVMIYTPWSHFKCVWHSFFCGIQNIFWRAALDPIDSLYGQKHRFRR